MTSLPPPAPEPSPRPPNDLAGALLPPAVQCCTTFSTELITTPDAASLLQGLNRSFEIATLDAELRGKLECSNTDLVIALVPKLASGVYDWLLNNGLEKYAAAGRANAERLETKAHSDALTLFLGRKGEERSKQIVFIPVATLTSIGTAAVALNHELWHVVQNQAAFERKEMVPEVRREQLAYGASIPSINRVWRQLQKDKRDPTIAQIRQDIDDGMARDRKAASSWR